MRLRSRAAQQFPLNRSIRRVASAHGARLDAATSTHALAMPRNAAGGSFFWVRAAACGCLRGSRSGRIRCRPTAGRMLAQAGDLRRLLDGVFIVCVHTDRGEQRVARGRCTRGRCTRGRCRQGEVKVPTRCARQPTKDKQVLHLSMRSPACARAMHGGGVCGWPQVATTGKRDELSLNRPSPRSPPHSHPHTSSGFEQEARLGEGLEGHFFEGEKKSAARARARRRRGGGVAERVCHAVSYQRRA